MIDKIIIKYFQSHKITKLKLHKGINGIIGKPNSGKSAIIRSILLLKNNRPTGFAYHNNHTKNPATEVQIKIKKQPWIKFKKQRSKAEYHYGKTIYKKFGKDIPDTIVNSLNLNEINFGLQLGLPFLILSSPTEIARQINEVTESSIINKCIKKTNENLNEFKRTKLNLTTQIEEFELNLKPYKKLDIIKSLLKKATYFDKQINKKKDTIKELNEIKTFIINAKTAIQNQQKPLKAKTLLGKAQVISFDIENITNQLILLEKVKLLIQLQKKEIRKKKLLINQYIKHLKISKSCPTCQTTITGRTLQAVRKELKK